MAGGKTQSRNEVKKAVYRDVLFGKLIQHGPVSDVFRKLWPNIYDAVRALKTMYGYKILSQILQRMESTIMIDGVCGRIVAELPGVRFLTIHDAALVVAGHAEKTSALIEEEFRCYGVAATVRPKNHAQTEEEC